MSGNKIEMNNPFVRSIRALGNLADGAEFRDTEGDFRSAIRVLEAAGRITRKHLKRMHDGEISAYYVTKDLLEAVRLALPGQENQNED